jgi:sirohydrochlorin ferrochelatase
MPLVPQQLDETELERRLQHQKALVAHLVSEGKQTAEANATLYELSDLLQRTREQRKRRLADSSGSAETKSAAQ